MQEPIEQKFEQPEIPQTPVTTPMINQQEEKRPRLSREEARELLISHGIVINPSAKVESRPRLSREEARGLLQEHHLLQDEGIPSHHQNMLKFAENFGAGVLSDVLELGAGALNTLRYPVALSLLPLKLLGKHPLGMLPRLTAPEIGEPGFAKGLGQFAGFLIPGAAEEKVGLKAAAQVPKILQRLRGPGALPAIARSGLEAGTLTALLRAGQPIEPGKELQEVGLAGLGGGIFGAGIRAPIAAVEAPIAALAKRIGLPGAVLRSRQMIQRITNALRGRGKIDIGTLLGDPSLQNLFHNVVRKSLFSGAALPQESLMANLNQRIFSFLKDLNPKLSLENLNETLRKGFSQRQSATKLVDILKGGIEEGEIPEKLTGHVKDLVNNLEAESKRGFSAISQEAKDRFIKFGQKFSNTAAFAKDVLAKREELEAKNLPLPDIQELKGVLNNLAAGAPKEAKRLTFNDAMESIKNVDELKRHHEIEKNAFLAKTYGKVSSLLKNDVEDRLKNEPDLLGEWQQHRKKWAENVLPFRTKRIQQALRQNVGLKTFHKDLLSPENELAKPISRLSEEGKRLLGFQSLREASDFDEILGKESINPQKLISEFDKHFKQQPNLKTSVFSPSHLRDIENVRANQIKGIDANVHNIVNKITTPAGVRVLEKASPEVKKNVASELFRKSFGEPERLAELEEGEVPQLNVGTFAQIARKLPSRVRKILFNDAQEKEIKNLKEMADVTRELRVEAAPPATGFRTAGQLIGAGAVPLAGGGVGAAFAPEGERGRGFAIGAGSTLAGNRLVRELLVSNWLRNAILRGHLPPFLRRGERALRTALIPLLAHGLATPAQQTGGERR